MPYDLLSLLYPTRHPSHAWAASYSAAHGVQTILLLLSEDVTKMHVLQTSWAKVRRCRGMGKSVGDVDSSAAQFPP